MKITSFVVTGLIAGMLAFGFGCKSSNDIGANMVPGPNADEMGPMATIPPNSGLNGNGSGSGIGGPGTGVDGLDGKGGRGLGDVGDGSVAGGGENLKGLNDWEKIPGLNLGIIYFAFDSDRIQESERSKLESAAEYMKTKAPQIGMIIEGNCDERGSAEYNRGLGERRALAIRAYLINLGVAENRFQTISYGFERPAVQGHNEAAWAKNRRGELCGAKMK